MSDFVDKASNQKFKSFKSKICSFGLGQKLKTELNSEHAPERSENHSC